LGDKVRNREFKTTRLRRDG